MADFLSHTGGGFGGKETRTVPFSCAVAIAAKKSANDGNTYYD